MLLWNGGHMKLIKTNQWTYQWNWQDKKQVWLTNTIRIKRRTKKSCQAAISSLYSTSPKWLLNWNIQRRVIAEFFCRKGKKQHPKNTDTSHNQIVLNSLSNQEHLIKRKLLWLQVWGSKHQYLSFSVGVNQITRKLPTFYLWHWYSNHRLRRKNMAITIVN